MEWDIQTFNMEGVTMQATPSNRYLKLCVPGLAESRPSVLRGDKLLASFAVGSDAKEYKGYVHDVSCSELYLAFHSSFHARFIKGMKYNIRFTFRRTMLQLCHQGLELIKEFNPTMLFPPPVISLQDPATTALVRPVNRALNQEQMAAVKQIVRGECRPAPYVIFGPPGTGKTVTVVEAILQLTRLRSHEKILVCAPSNAAADLLVERLAKTLNSNEMLRLMAYQRNPKTVPEAVKPYCSQDDGGFTTPSRSRIEGYKVVVATCAIAAKVHNQKGIEDHFDVAFIDKAGHAWEPECVAAVAGVLRKDGQLVLAGDPKQLGPITRHSLATRHGLGQSLLQRVISRPAYARDEASYPDTRHNPATVTMLRHCYRMHPQILKIPNECFYSGDLIPSGNPVITEALCQWEHLPKRGFPLIFEGVDGEDMRESTSPSWFNALEAGKVLSYVHLLLEIRSSPVRPMDIGVVTPYQKQVQKIRMLLKAHDLGDVMVGSAEQFQGQERRVIIVSTVRSSQEFIDFDTKHQLGFVASPARFNVAVTRAQALLIVIGNPAVLADDDHWGRLLWHCVDNGAYRGCDLPPRGNGGEESMFGAMLSMLHLMSTAFVEAAGEGESEDFDFEMAGEGESEDFDFEMIEMDQGATIVSSTFQCTMYQVFCIHRETGQLPLCVTCTRL